MAPGVGHTDWAIDGTIYAVTLRDGMILQLTQVAALIWQAADTAENIAEVVQRLVASQGWSGEEIQFAVQEFVDDLVDVGLLVKSGSIE